MLSSHYHHHKSKTFSQLTQCPFTGTLLLFVFASTILITPITKIVNYSIKEGSFPKCFKMAYVTPLQKKPSLDRNILKNYRAVSNLSFIPKLIEKVVARQLNELISHEGLLNVNQSAYKSSNFTETALLKIQNDIAL